jgi:hypothetical protein
MAAGHEVLAGALIGHVILPLAALFCHCPRHNSYTLPSCELVYPIQTTKLVSVFMPLTGRVSNVAEKSQPWTFRPHPIDKLVASNHRPL